MRRYFVDALPKDIKTPDSTLSGKSIEFCNKLIHIEKELASLNPGERKK
jgi:transposase